LLSCGYCLAAIRSPAYALPVIAPSVILVAGAGDRLFGLLWRRKSGAATSDPGRHFHETRKFHPKPPAPDPAEANGSSIFGKDISIAAFNRALVLLILLGLIVRISFYVEHADTPSFGVPTLDQKYYDTVAKMLLAGEDLHELHGFRPLLYPMFLAFFYRLGATGAWISPSSCNISSDATGLLVRGWARDCSAIGWPAWWAGRCSAGSPAALLRRGAVDRAELHVSDLSGFAAPPAHGRGSRMAERAVLVGLRRQ